MAPIEKKLILADGLHLPAMDALESVFAVIGKRGRGKSGFIKVLMEEFCKAELPFISFDPTSHHVSGPTIRPPYTSSSGCSRSS